MNQQPQSGDMCKVGKTGRKAEVIEVNGAVTQVAYNDGKTAIVPTRWIRK